MILLILLKDERRLQTLVNVLVELEMFDGTVLDGEAIENLASQTVPLFQDVGQWFGFNLAYNRVLLIWVRDRRQFEQLMFLCRRDGLDLRDPAVARWTLIPSESRWSTENAEISEA